MDRTSPPAGSWLIKISVLRPIVLSWTTASGAGLVDMPQVGEPALLFEVLTLILSNYSIVGRHGLPLALASLQIQHLVPNPALDRHSRRRIRPQYERVSTGCLPRRGRRSTNMAAVPHLHSHWRRYIHKRDSLLRVLSLRLRHPLRHHHRHRFGMVQLPLV